MTAFGGVLATILSAISAAPIGVHLEEHEDVPLQDAMAIVEALSNAISRATARPMAIDDPTWISSCTTADRCRSDIHARTHADEIVMVRLYAGVLKIHAICELLAADQLAPGQPHIAEANLDRDRAMWAESLDSVARQLFPRPPAIERAATSTRSEAIVPSSGPDAATWILLGTGAAAAGVGVALGVDATKTRDRIESTILSAPDYGDASRRLDRDKLAANILFGVAIAAIAGAAVKMILE
jgi:hypothetical protein